MLEKFANNIIAEIKKNFTNKGHHLSGKFEKSLRSEILKYSVKIFGEDYGIYLDKGVPAANVPYSLPSGRGGKSKYIEGLMRYGKSRLGLTGKQQKAFAFAVAYKHKKQGIRLREHGKGTHFFTSLIPQIKQDGKLIFSKEFKHYLEIELKTYINEFNN